MSQAICESDVTRLPHSSPEEGVATRRARLSVVALAACAFIFVTAEVLPVGLLPQISSSLGVSEGRVGFLLTLYAALAGITAIPLTMRTSRVQRDRLLVILMAIFTGSTVLSALAPTYPLLAASRLVCALAHGVFWAVLTPTVSRIAGPARAGRATSMVFIGTALATVLGVPLSTVLGVTLGWRAAMGVVAGFGLLVVLALRVLLPALPARESHASVPLRQILASRPLRAVALTTAVIVIGQFTAYTYIAPLLKRQVGLGGIGLSVVLLAFGVAGLIGNLIGGRFVDGRPGVVLGTSFALLGLSFLLIELSRGHLSLAVLAVVVWGLSFSAVPLCVQSAVLRVSAHAPDVGSAVIVVAFQIGIGGGALLGGALVDAGRVTVLPWIGLATVVVGTILAFSVPQTFPRRRALASV
jgi:predicted MFS family arabinose efflux permease